MSLFGSQESEGTAVVAEQGKPGFVAEARSVIPEGEGAKEEVPAKTEEEIAEEQRQAEGAAGKTPEQLAEEKRIADEEAAKNAAKTPEQIEAEKKEADSKAAQELNLDTIRKEERAKFLKEFGVTTEAELAAKLNPAKPETPEQIKERENIYQADLANYAVKSKAFQNDEWLAFQNISKMPNDTLVYNDFANTYKEVNKDRKNGEGHADPVTDDEIKDRFNELYHTDSENAILKEQGQKNIDVKAASIKAPLQQKYDDVKAVYDHEISEKQAIPSFKTFFQDVFEKAIPLKMEFGEGDDKVVYDLSTLDKAELEKFFIGEIGPRELTDFMKGKGTQEQRDRITNAIKKEIVYRNHAKIAEENFKAGVSKGTKIGAKGSNVPFIEPAKREVKVGDVKITEQDQKAVANAFG